MRWHAPARRAAASPTSRPELGPGRATSLYRGDDCSKSRLINPVRSLSGSCPKCNATQSILNCSFVRAEADDHAVGPPKPDRLSSGDPVMTRHSLLAGILVATTALGGAAYAAEHAAPPMTAQVPLTESPAQKSVDRDDIKLSADGAAAYRDMGSARLALFEVEPSRAGRRRSSNGRSPPWPRPNPTTPSLPEPRPTCTSPRTPRRGLRRGTRHRTAPRRPSRGCPSTAS
jgi:hypothetical protein